MMTKEKFDNIYKDRGGVKKFKELMNGLYTIENIATYFGVTKNAVRLWSREMFGKNYDPRKIRRTKVIKQMIAYAKGHSEEEFRKEFKNVSSYYYRIALNECYSKGIYKR